jgi:hypothetical protein
MKITVEEFKVNLTIISRRLGLETNYKSLIESNSLPEMVKLLIYDMFVQGVNSYFEEDDQVFRSIQNIKEYCNELKTNGFVVFK